MRFYLRKILSQLLFPMPLTLIILVAGLILSRSRWERAGRALLIVGTLLLLIFSMPLTSGALLRPLETRYPPLGSPGSMFPDWETINTIVVFVGCQVVDPSQPITRQVGANSMARLVEGVRLYQECPACTLILSGGGSRCDLNVPVERLTNYRLAVMLGVAPEDIVIERESWDTADQARILSNMLGETPFIVVTSASHMPRSMAWLEAQGLQAIPAPTDYASDIILGISWDSPGLHTLYPDARSVWRSERAVYEYLGLLWFHLRGLLTE